ncbi:MAG TPA: GNAT family protein [Gaiellaceae bacterium]|nr:GNAT family protein [Gaiellaceae bacterium]
MPRRLIGFRRPAPPLADDAVRLEPLHRGLQAEFRWVVDGDEDIRRFTYVPSAPDPEFLERWLGRYEDGWETGTCAGFAIRGADDGPLIGFAALVHLDLDRRESEIGYMLEQAARGRGAATRAVDLLTRWGFDTLGLERLELRISAANTASQRVAQKAGYQLDGVLRGVSFKEGLRDDVSVWSRLASD